MGTFSIALSWGNSGFSILVMRLITKCQKPSIGAHETAKQGTSGPVGGPLFFFLSGDNNLQQISINPVGCYIGRSRKSPATSSWYRKMWWSLCISVMLGSAELARWSITFSLVFPRPHRDDDNPPNFGVTGYPIFRRTVSSTLSQGSEPNPQYSSISRSIITPPWVPSVVNECSRA